MKNWLARIRANINIINWPNYKLIETNVFNVYVTRFEVLSNARIWTLMCFFKMTWKVNITLLHQSIDIELGPDIQAKTIIRSNEYNPRFSQYISWTFPTWYWFSGIYSLGLFPWVNHLFFIRLSQKSVHLSASFNTHMPLKFVMFHKDDCTSCPITE